MGRYYRRRNYRRNDNIITYLILAPIFLFYYCIKALFGIKSANINDDYIKTNNVLDVKAKRTKFAEKLILILLYCVIIYLFFATKIMEIKLICILFITILAVINAVVWVNRHNKSIDNQIEKEYIIENKIVTDTNDINLIKNKSLYQKKNLMTACEKVFYNKLKKSINDNYIIQPQIPLSSIIDKNRNATTQWANELYRTIDFGIFDENFNIICCIELNDRTHELKERIKRDNKVKDILKQANIPLITFWTYEDINEILIQNRLKRLIS